MSSTFDFLVSKDYIDYFIKLFVLKIKFKIFLEIEIKYRGYLLASNHHFHYQISAG
jgi:hypothetical protein